MNLRDLWKSPRGTVLRIETLALGAIAFSLFLAAFGSCRRWSNRWIIQKGFLVAHALSLSLGTYSIGLMQSSSVKSDMYPIWAVSLLTLLGCIDSVTAYNSLDYKGPFLKTIFQLCLYCGYVLLMSVSTISSVVGNSAIVMLSAITFIKGFHRSLALVLPTETRNQLRELVSTELGALAGDGDGLEVHLPVHFEGGQNKIRRRSWIIRTSMADIHLSCKEMVGELGSGVTANDKTFIEDVCLGYSLSHLLQRRFLGLDTSSEMEEKKKTFESLVQDGRVIDYKRALRAIEFELAFVYEVFFTSNEFLHYYQAKGASIWTLASFIGICLLGVLVAVFPGTMASRHHHVTSTSHGAGTVIVGTTTADLVISLSILVSLALLQLVQLFRCWTSNWARVAFACEYNARRLKEKIIIKRWMGMKAFIVTRMNWFDKYLWQDKIGQHSVVPASSRRRRRQPVLGTLRCMCFLCLCGGHCQRWTGFLKKVIGVHYTVQVLGELLLSDTNTGPAIRLHDDVKTSVADFVVHIKSRTIGKDWWSLFDANGIASEYLPYTNAPLLLDDTLVSEAYAFTHRVLMWQVATWYCDKAEQGGTGADATAGGEQQDREKNRRVANALSRYCAYLVVSAPALLPGPAEETKSAYNEAEWRTRDSVNWVRVVLEAMPWEVEDHRKMPLKPDRDDVFWTGVYWGKRLRNETLPQPQPECTTTRPCADDPWKVLALLWVQTLLYVAPYGDMQMHMQRLSQGGEFITHLWALLYHVGIDSWELEDAQDMTKEEEIQVAHVLEPEEQAQETTGTSSNITRELVDRGHKDAPSLTLPSS